MVQLDWWTFANNTSFIGLRQGLKIQRSPYRCGIEFKCKLLALIGLMLIDWRAIRGLLANWYSVWVGYNLSIWCNTWINTRHYTKPGKQETWIQCWLNVGHNIKPALDLRLLFSERGDYITSRTFRWLGIAAWNLSWQWNCRCGLLSNGTWIKYATG